MSGHPRTDPVPPCKLCGNPGGQKGRTGRVIRCSGEKYGVSGFLCNICYGRLYVRRKAMRDGTSQPDYVPSPEEIAEAAQKERDRWPNVACRTRRKIAEGEAEMARIGEGRAKLAERARLERLNARLERLVTTFS